MWNDEKQQVFNDIKQKVGTSLILSNPVKGKHLCLCPDASDNAVGATLEQEGEDGQWHVLVYGSCSLSDADRKWSMTEKEFCSGALHEPLRRKSPPGKEESAKIGKTICTLNQGPTKVIGNEQYILLLLAGLKEDYTIMCTLINQKESLKFKQVKAMLNQHALTLYRAVPKNPP